MQQPGMVPLEQIEFRVYRRAHIILGVVFGTLWVLLALGVGAYLVGMLRAPDWRDRLDEILPAAIFVVVISLLIWHVVLWPLRLRFSDEGVHQFFLVCWRFRRWRDVRRAWLERIRGATYITLHFGAWRFMLIPIGGYRQQRRLYDEIARRLPVPIKGSALVLNALVDEPDRIPC